MRERPDLGVGLGWRRETAALIERRAQTGFVEVIAEGVDRCTPRELDLLGARGVPIVAHGVTLSLGGAELPARERVERLARVAERLRSPLVSEHVCFVRSGGMDSGHLLPVPRTREMLSILVENVRFVQDQLPVPLALENIAGLFEWPDAEMDEATFLGELVEQTDTLLLLDLANLHANARNLGWDPIAFLDRLPLERVAYMHVAGGVLRGDVYVDSHAHAVPPSVFDLIEEVASRIPSPNILLERDAEFPEDGVLEDELDAIAEARTRGTRRYASRASLHETRSYAHAV